MARGQGVDAHGDPVGDPTANVVALVEAGLQRQDDLREAFIKHFDETLNLHRQHAAQLREAESKRIDAIRAVDVGAVTRAAEVSAAQALTLATQVATSAETLRNQVQAAAVATANALSAALEPLNVSIADLRRAQYEAQGQKTQIIEKRSSNSAVYAAIGLGITLFLVFLTIAGFILARLGQ